MKKGNRSKTHVKKAAVIYILVKSVHKKTKPLKDTCKEGCCDKPGKSVHKKQKTQKWCTKTEKTTTNTTIVNCR